MAGDAGHRSGRLADRFATTATALSGFVCFSLSNLLWVIWGVHAGAYALIVLQLCLFLMNLRGFMKNRVSER